MRIYSSKKEQLNLSIGDLARGKQLRSYRLHNSDGSSLRVSGDTTLIVIEEYNKENPGLFFKWKVFCMDKIFFAYDEDLEAVK